MNLDEMIAALLEARKTVKGYTIPTVLINGKLQEFKSVEISPPEDVPGPHLGTPIASVIFVM